MLAQDYLSSKIPALSVSRTIGEAVRVMKTRSLAHAPVVETVDLPSRPRETHYVGLLSLSSLEQQLKSAEDKDALKMQTLGSLDQLETPSVYAAQHIFDAGKSMIDNQITVLPVVDMQNRYVGAIGLEEIARCFADVTASRDPGAIIVLEVDRIQYTPTQICNIIESNRGVLLSLSLSAAPEPTNLYVNLKLSVNDIVSIVMGFERFGYRIAHVFSDQNLRQNTEEHYNSLMRFLDV